MFSYRNKKILIVDDQKAFHVMLKAMLTNQGAENITFAESAEQAARITNLDQFDIYLLDYNLGGGKNGVQLFDYLKRNDLIPEHALCFIITGDSNKKMVLTAMEKSPDDYLMKPFSPIQLSNRLTAAMQRKQVLQEINEAVNNDKFEVAISLCQQKIDAEPKFRALCKNVLADIYIQMGQFSNAERILKPMVDLRPLVHPSISLGRLYFLQEDYTKSIEVLTRLISYAPMQMEAYQWLARAYKHDGQLQNALNILSHAATTTHHSIERHQEVALLATEMEEYILMLSSYASILHLSRNSFYPDPCHLANYLRSIVAFAKKEDDMKKRKDILKKVASTLYQSRFEEGKNKDFNFDGFDQIYQANVLLALNEPLKAKRRIFNTLSNTTEEVADFDTTFLTESLFSLLDIGEFEEASPFLAELEQRNIVDQSTQLSIKKHTGELLDNRINSFTNYNKLGIKFFREKQFSQAIESFDQALALEPVNTGALLNRSQVFIKMLQEMPQRKDHQALIKQCQNSFILLNNTHLPEQYAKRLKALQQELADIRAKVK
ncbi:response regulator [Vibrio sp. 1-Bac 57]|uniref:response regulator n=1 Tax=Psychromonas sp. SA13A TaxID=2686346 RepID=UPI00140CAA50|nr:response regulator [Psychromonas sp. SA13A]